MTNSLPHSVIVGGGFGGLAAARALRNAPVRVASIDRLNHYLFQPLLYQVTTVTLAVATSPRRFASYFASSAMSQRAAADPILAVEGERVCWAVAGLESVQELAFGPLSHQAIRVQVRNILNVLDQ